jgi:AmiR/NasT family two-component response regulator
VQRLNDGAVLPGTAEELRQVRSELETLRGALESRQTIGVALGMVMLRFGLDLDRAFEYLSRRSQTENVKLRLVAEQVVNELSAEGWPRR